MMYPVCNIGPEYTVCMCNTESCNSPGNTANLFALATTTTTTTTLAPGQTAVSNHTHRKRVTQRIQQGRPFLLASKFLQFDLWKHTVLLTTIPYCWPVLIDQYSLTSTHWPVLVDQYSLTSTRWPVLIDQYSLTSAHPVAISRYRPMSGLELTEAIYFASDLPTTWIQIKKGDPAESSVGSIIYILFFS